jgi:ribonuclease P protein component
LRYIKRTDGPTRLGFAVARDIKSKAKKNRLKRRLREICRKHLDRIEDGLDIVVNINSTAVAASYVEIERDFVRITEQAGIGKNIRKERERL